MVFDVKYDQRYKARLVAGGNWKAKEKVYITAAPKFGVDLHG
jgi:hypothetical protein